MSYVNATRDFKWPLLAPIGFHDDGHASGTGHYKGGIYGGTPFRGSFANGGIVPGPVGAPAMIEAHGGEAVLPNGMELHADIYIGGQRIDERVDVRLDARARKVDGAWDQGIR
jgi:hypothetical protein